MLIFHFILGFLVYSILLMTGGILLFGFIRKFEDVKRLLFITSLLCFVTFVFFKELHLLTVGSYSEFLNLGMAQSCIICSFLLFPVTKNIKTLEKYGKRLSLFGHGLLTILNIITLLFEKSHEFFYFIYFFFLLSIILSIFVTSRYGSVEKENFKFELQYCKYFLPIIPIFIVYELYSINKIALEFNFLWVVLISAGGGFVYITYLKLHLQMRQKKFEKNQNFDKIEFDILTTKENEVLNYVLIGCSNSDISVKCAISIYTVKSHVKNIFRKMNVKSRFELISKVKIQGHKN